MTLFGLIPWIARLLMRRNAALTPGHAKRLAALMAWAAVAIVSALLLWWMVDSIGDAREAKITAERTADALEGEQRANAAGQQRDEARAEAIDDIEDELETIHAEDPDSTTRPASRGTRAIAERMRDD